MATRPRPEEYLPDSLLPDQWDWRSVVVQPGAPPIHFTTRIRNQFLPLWCGSCWAHAATAVLGSRWNIHTNASASGIDFSVQCAPSTPPLTGRCHLLRAVGGVAGSGGICG